jgi:hypothetical protein
MSKENTGTRKGGHGFGDTLKEGRKRLKIKMADLIYVLDIQNKNPHVDRVLADYGLDRDTLKRVKAALERGRWKVQV